MQHSFDAAALVTVQVFFVVFFILLAVVPVFVKPSMQTLHPFETIFTFSVG